MATITARGRRSARLRLDAGGLPDRLEWNARVYRVSDRPTRLEDALGALCTHPLPASGWRFQGTAQDDGSTLVFDVLRSDDGWCVLTTYR